MVTDQNVADFARAVGRDYNRLDKKITDGLANLPEGKPGDDGKSAYQLWLDQGNEGTPSQFLDSLKGRDGDDGSDGKDGAEGLDGVGGGGGSSADGDASVTVVDTPSVTRYPAGIVGQVATSMAVYTPIWSTKDHIFVTAPVTIDGQPQTRLARLNAATGAVEQEVLVDTISAHDQYTGHRPASVAVTDEGTVLTHPTLHHAPWVGKHSLAGRVRDIVGLAATPTPTGLDKHTSYRRFFRDPYTGAIWLVSRGNDYRAYIFRWNNTTRSWDLRGGGPFADPGAYGHELAFGPGGVMWAAPEWRVNASGAQSGYPRRDIALVKSADGGTTWTRADGAAVSLPLKPGNGTVVFPGIPGAQITSGHSGVLARVAVDGDGRPVVVASWRHPLKDGDYRSLWFARVEEGGKITRQRLMQSHAQWDVGNPHLAQGPGGYIVVSCSRRDDHLPASSNPSNSEVNSSNYPDSSLALLTTEDGGDTWSRCDIDGGVDGLGASGAWLDPQSLRLSGLLRLIPISQKTPSLSQVWALIPPGAPAPASNSMESGVTTTTDPNPVVTPDPDPEPEEPTPDLALASYEAAVMEDSPYALWMLDESTGDSADSKGASPAVPSGALTRPGNDLTSFDGGHFKAGTVNNYGSGMSTNGVTIEFLIRSTDRANRRAVLGSVNTGFTTALSVFVNSVSNGSTVTPDTIALVMRNNAGGNRAWSFPAAVFDGEVHHIALVSNLDTGFTAYVDGVAVAATASNVSGASGAGAYSNFQNAMALGATNGRGTIESLFMGALGGIALHNKQLSAARIAAHAAAY